jgi:hypothetical protein
MLRRLSQLAGALAIVAATTAFGGDCLEGSTSCNACPLAQRANKRLATGHEAVSVSKTIRKDIVEAILANLEAI